MINRINNRIKAGWIVCCCSIGMLACKRNGEATAATHIAIGHFVPNADSLSVQYDGSRIGGNTALSYGAVTTQNGLAYLTPGSGTHTMRILAGSRIVRDNIYTFRAGRYYTLLLYDSLKNDTVKVALLQDRISPVDTLAQVRFINMIADTGAVQIRFRKDTTLAASDTYLGSKSSRSYPFSTLRPGSWNISLEKNNAVIVQPAAFDLQAGKLYSFVAKGRRGGTGVYAESLLLMKHN